MNRIKIIFITIVLLVSAYFLFSKTVENFKNTFYGFDSLKGACAMKMLNKKECDSVPGLFQIPQTSRNPSTFKNF